MLLHGNHSSQLLFLQAMKFPMATTMLAMLQTTTEMETLMMLVVMLVVMVASETKMMTI
jgi:uncharacterized membrane protein